MLDSVLGHIVGNCHQLIECRLCSAGIDSCGCQRSTVGEAVVVEANARVENSILWPGARVTAGASLRRCIVRLNAIASGELSDADI